MKKRLLAITVAVATLSSSITAFAAPVTMPDGTLFDAEYYAQQNPDVVAAFGADSNALYRYYVNHGRSEGRKTHINDVTHMAAISNTAFDANYYAQQYPDVVAALGTNPNALYQHYMNHGKAEGRKAHINDIPIAAVGTAGNIAFDANYYAQQNPDVVAALGTDPTALYRHYVTHGQSEGRKAHMNDISHIAVTSTVATNNSAFDAGYYAQQNPDVVAALGTDSNTLYSHYVTHGQSEGRKAHR